MKNRVQATTCVFSGLWIPLLMGCTGNVVVGSEDEDEMEKVVEIEETTLHDVLARDRFVLRPVNIQPEETCSREDAPRVRYRNEWLAQGNAMGNLAGSLWRGDIDSGPVMELAIAADGSAFVHWGDQGYLPRPTDPEMGWGCDRATYSYTAGEVCASRPKPGVEHSVRGASFDGSRLIMTIQTYEPWDEWCSLQTRHRHDIECFHSPSPFADTSVGGNGQCSYDGKSPNEWTLVDCMAMELRSTACECTASRCMAVIASAEWTTMSFDLRLSADGTTLDGGMKYFETGPIRVQLSRVE